jgi:hypothetical protein
MKACGSVYVRGKRNRMDRIDRIKARRKDECGMKNERQAASYSSFILLPSSFLLYPVYPVYPC